MIENHSKNKYVIHSPSERGFWNNDLGWVGSMDDATEFDHRWVFHFSTGMMLPPPIMSKSNDAVWAISVFGE